MPKSYPFTTCLKFYLQIGKYLLEKGKNAKLKITGSEFKFKMLIHHVPTCSNKEKRLARTL